jgi:hypothetical protein
MALAPSRVATLGNINERPGRLTVATIGADCAADLEAAGLITIRKGKCYPTAFAAPYRGRSAAKLATDTAAAEMHLRAAMGR